MAVIEEVLRPDDHSPKSVETEVAVATPGQIMRWKFMRHRVAVVSLAVLVLFYLVALFAEFVAPYDPARYDTDFMMAPPQPIRFIDNGRFELRPFVYGLSSAMDPNTFKITYQVDPTQKYPIYFFVRGDPYKLWGVFETDLHLFGVKEGTLHLFGTDNQGRDMLSRIIYGGRISLSVGLLGIAISFIIGIVVGGISGYFGGVVDIIIQRVIEFLRSIPTLPLWMALSVALPPTWSVVQTYFGIVVILSLVGWTGLARVVRGKFMSLREEEYVMAAQLNGANEARIIFKHMLPSFYSHIIASLTLSVPGMILGETALSFIGLGLQPPAISWGVLLKDAQHIRVLANAPWLLLPGLFVVVAILCFNFVGDGLRDAADPYVN
ncbi:peptide ABC transporter permease [Litorilinea aerophila]|nr:peptide ABC transporter permease [Litorilinea aerophila]